MSAGLECLDDELRETRGNACSQLGLAVLVIAAMLICQGSASASPTLTAEPEVVTGGQPVSVAGACSQPERCRFVVELGRVEAFSVTDGMARATWVLPPDGPPRRVAAALVDEALQTVSFVTVELHRMARVDVVATPGAKVMLYLGPTLASTGTADARGRLSMRVSVPPGGRVARVEQKTNRKHVAPPRIDQLPVSDELHMFAVAVEREVLPGRSFGLHVLTYRDASEVSDSGTTCAEANQEKALGKGRMAFVVATTLEDRRLRPTYEVHCTARQGSSRADATVSGDFGALPAERVELLPERTPLIAGSRASLVIRGFDALGEAAIVDARFAALAPYESTRLERKGDRLLVDVAGPLVTRELRLVAYIDGVAPSVTSLELSPADGAQLTVEAIDATSFRVLVRDIFGNPTDRARPRARAERGSVDALAHIEEGEWLGRWSTAAPKRNREVARVVTELPESDAEASIVMHRYRAWALETGAYGGALFARGDIRAVGGQVLVQARLPALPARLSVDVGAGLWLASRTQSAGSQSANREIALAPLGVGASWEIPLDDAWRVDLGALVGALRVATRVNVRNGGVELVPLTGTAGWTTQFTPWVRLARVLGPGAVAIMAQGLVARDVEGLRRSPLGTNVSIGYAWDP